MGTLADTLRIAVESGDWAEIRARLAPGAVLHTSNESGRRSVAGADAFVAHLSGPGPGEIRDWDAQEWPTGLALSFEWEGASGTDRRRWYVRTGENAAIAELWSTAARPTGRPRGRARRGAREAARPPRCARRGPAQPRRQLGRRAPARGGPGGVLRPEARVLVRLGLARARDPRHGRTAQLHDAGVFAAMPPEIGHGIVAVERSGDGAWIAMRDVKDLLLDPAAASERDESRRILRAAAALHRTFRGRDLPGAARLADRIGMSAPAVADAERPNPDLLPKQFEQGWDAFSELADADVADAVLAHVGQPTRSRTRCSPPTAARRSSTATCAATTSASTATGSCSSTGTSRRPAPRRPSSPGTSRTPRSASTRPTTRSRPPPRGPGRRG